MGKTNNDIVIIGAGNVATHLAQKLFSEGCCIRQIFSRTENAAHTLAEKVNAVPITDLRRTDKAADLYIIAVKDDAIASVLPYLACVRGLVVHTSGSAGIEVFENCRINNYGVLYPMQTFSKKRAIDFHEVPFFIEACDEENLHAVSALAHIFSDHVTVTTSEQRRKIHLGAVFACNFTNHMYALTEQILKEACVPFEIMRPLINETVQKTKEMSPVEAQTGPAVRYDKTVMNKHLRLIEDIRTKEIYIKISESIHAFAEKREKETNE